MSTIKSISDLQNNITKMRLKLDLLTKLSAAQNQIAEGDKGKTLKQVMGNIRKTINAAK